MSDTGILLAALATLSLGLPVPVGVVVAQAVPAMTVRSGALSFDGKATLGDFTGTTTSVTGAMTGAATVEGVRGWVEAPARSLVTGNGRRDRDMYSSLETDRFPTLRFELDDLSAGPVQGDSLPTTLRGRFTIHGVTREHAVPGWLWLAEGTARFRGQLPMNLKSYEIGGLSKMLGLLKMEEEIVVRMDVTFESQKD
jgi:polyisoprenoid-binding protein YceI